MRDYDGKIREVERRGPSMSAAKSRLHEAIRDRHKAETGAEITSETKLADVARIWLADLHAEIAAGEKSTGAGELYQTRAQRIIEEMGSLRVREVTVGRVDRLLAAIATHNGPMSAKRAKDGADRRARPGRASRRHRDKPGAGHRLDQVRTEEDRDRGRFASGLRPVGEAGR